MRPIGYTVLRDGRNIGDGFVDTLAQASWLMGEWQANDNMVSGESHEYHLVAVLSEERT